MDSVLTMQVQHTLPEERIEPDLPIRTTITPVVEFVGGVEQSTAIKTSNAAVSAIVRDEVARITADAVTDIRKGQAAIVDRIVELSNAVMGLKNSVIAINQTLADIKSANGKKAAVVYVNKQETPEDLFGNNEKK